MPPAGRAALANHSTGMNHSPHTTPRLDVALCLPLGPALPPSQALYRELQTSWLTPVEIFQPHYGRAIASCILQRWNEQVAGRRRWPLPCSPAWACLDPTMSWHAAARTFRGLSPLTPPPLPPLTLAGGRRGGGGAARAPAAHLRDWRWHGHAGAERAGERENTHVWCALHCSCRELCSVLWHTTPGCIHRKLFRTAPQDWLREEHPAAYRGCRYSCIEISPVLAALQRHKVRAGRTGLCGAQAWWEVSGRSLASITP